jgi:hypothetical protein
MSHKASLSFVVSHQTQTVKCLQFGIYLCENSNFIIEVLHDVKDRFLLKLLQHFTTKEKLLFLCNKRDICINVKVREATSKNKQAGNTLSY